MKVIRNMLERVRNRKGQTALEYALVIAVIAVVIIAAAKGMFGGDKGVATQVFEKSVKAVSNQISE